MKHLLVLLFILLACMAAGCLTSDNGNDTKDEVSDGGSYTITGKVVDSSGAGISGVSVVLTGETAEKTAGENVNLSVSTNSDGSYSFLNIKNGFYLVTVSKSGLELEPPNRAVQISGSNVTVPDFTGSADTNGGDGGDDKVYTVSGTIVDSSGNGISGVTVVIAGGTISLTDVTDSGGNYSFDDVPVGAYSIIPSGSDYSFSPEFMSAMVSGNDVIVGAITGTTDSGGDGGDGGTVSGDAGSHSFYPLKKGASWTYHVINTESDSNEPDEYDYTIKITGTEVVEGKEYWVMVDEDDEFDGYFRIEDGIVYVYGGDEVYAKIPKMFAKALSTGKADVDVTPYDSELPLIDLNAGIGQTFVIMDFSESDSGLTVSTKMTGKYIGNKNMSVTSGNFNNCRHYELITEYSISSSFFSSSSKSTTQAYLAPNVGLIKSTDIYVEDENLLWTYDEELTSYNIP